MEPGIQLFGTELTLEYAQESVGGGQEAKPVVWVAQPGVWVAQLGLQVAQPSVGVALLSLL